jgi:membrane-bound ClpP family serine protease
LFFRDRCPMDSNAVFAVLLLIVGLSILIAEVFIPSGGLLGVTTFFTLIVSLIFAYRAWGVSHPNVFGVFCVALLLLVPTALGFGFYMLPRTSLGKKVLLEAPESQYLTPYSKESGRIEKLIGQYGTALTMLNPGGLVNVAGQRLHAISDGLSVEPGTSLKIVNVRGTRVVVRAEMPPVNVSNPTSTVAEPAVEETSTLDFEFPTNS